MAAAASSSETTARRELVITYGACREWEHPQSIRVEFCGCRLLTGEKKRRVYRACATEVPLEMAVVEWHEGQDGEYFYPGVKVDKMYLEQTVQHYYELLDDIFDLCCVPIDVVLKLELHYYDSVAPDPLCKALHQQYKWSEVESVREIIVGLAEISPEKHERGCGWLSHFDQ
jgi:hypothetical protein